MDNFLNAGPPMVSENSIKKISIKGKEDLNTNW